MLNTWTGMALWLLPACLVGLAILGGALWTLRRQRNCPSCRTPMRPLAGPGTEVVGDTVVPGGVLSSPHPVIRIVLFTDGLLRDIR